ncbi:ejaculatory bulb-specific protein 3-like [Thrips palmi]|uniref:Ejaculatory bulb-specific protein 3-like n=1 Tax=Thrips palmi TaxID=161013 RepID=A0A6P8Z2T7_THRPL|nr:ejaculatory bulb-specific protein 3-like [Thrips palmi]
MSKLQLSAAVAALAALAALAPSTRAQKLTAATIRAQDVDSILSNDRLLSSFVNCVLDKKPCSQDGRELRKSIPQALSTGCASCSPNQKVLTERVIRHLRAKRPRDWAALTAKYDPSESASHSE